MKKLDEQLEKRLAAVVIAMGYIFSGYELRRQDGEGLLRIYINKEGGVTLDDCVLVSRQVSAMLNVEEDPLPGNYHLEVSSPGVKSRSEACDE